MWGRWGVGCILAVSALLTAPMPAGAVTPVPAPAPILVPRSPASAAVGKAGKLSPRLAVLVSGAGFASPRAESRSLSLPAAGAGSLIRRAGGRVLVQIRTASTSAAVVAKLRSLGAQVVNVSRTYLTVTASVAPAALEAIASDGAVRYVTEVLAPQTAGTGPLRSNAGAAPAACAPVVSEGDTLMNGALARNTNDIDGTGETIGIFSDSFDTAPNAPTRVAGDVAAGDLPGPGNPCGYTTPVTVQSDYSGGDQEDEGRAMAQLAHALAPGARLAFATADNGELDLASQIETMRTVNHATVLVDDVSYLDEPFFQDGPLANAVNAASAAGVPYFSAAGNANVIVGGANVSSYEASAFRATSCPVLDEPAVSCHDFDPTGGTSNTDQITLAPGGGFGLDLQWAQPQGAVSTDLDAFVISASGSILAESEVKNPASQVPFEFLDYSNSTASSQTVRIVIAKYSGLADPRLKFVLLGASGITGVQFAHSAGGDIVGPSIFGHNGTSTVGSTAAVPYSNASVAESFSSRGPETHYFEPTPSTAPLAGPEVLDKPDFAATDGVRTSFFLQQTNGVWRFYGTSAAAPQAAAVGALLIDKDPLLTPAQVIATLRDTARTVANNGTTDAVGGGYIDADAALNSVSAFPGAPQSVHATADNGRADLSWSVPLTDGGQPIVGYTITPYVAGVSESPQTFNASTTSAVAAGLTNGTSYTFTVTAIGANGAGPPSGQSPSVTVGTPTAPSALTVTPSGSGRAKLAWVAPKSDNGSKITGYVVTPLLFGIVVEPARHLSPATTGTVTGLTNGDVYTFEVAATNSQGTGAASSDSDPVTIGLPGRPTILAVAPADSGAVISFTAPAANGSPIFGYTFTAYIGSAVYSEGSLSNATRQMVGLPNGKAFRLTIGAVNNAGSGPPSALTGPVIAGAPAAAIAPRASPGHGSATVRWTAAPNNGAPITKYVITPYLDGVAQPAHTYESARTTETVAGLSNGKRYSFRIAAVNARGQGPQSSATASVTVGAPGAPTGVSARLNGRSVLVRWLRPSGNGSAISGYVVIPYLGSTALSARKFSSAATTQTITGLSPGNSYSFKVSAVNRRGTGPPSTPSKPITVR